MVAAEMKIESKSVRLSRPYCAPTSQLIGREEEMKKILAAWMRGSADLPLAPLLLGKPGLGKNRVVYECAKLCTKELFIFQGHEDVTAEDLVCAVRFSDDPEKKMDYLVSPLVTAMLSGGICFIDEIGKIRPRALAPLASLLDERRYLDSALLGERVHAHRGFRFIAATNTADIEGNLIPNFIRSRMRPVINIGYPKREQIEMIIKARYSTFRENGKPLLDRFWSMWTDRYGDKPPTPRDSIYIFAYALNLADFETIGQVRPYSLDTCKPTSTIKKEHLDHAFEAFQDYPAIE